MGRLSCSTLNEASMAEWFAWPENKPKYKSGFWRVRYQDGTEGICEFVQGRWLSTQKVVAFRLLVEGFEGAFPK